jgi:hypothetical protein
MAGKALCCPVSFVDDFRLFHPHWAVFRTHDSSILDTPTFNVGGHGLAGYTFDNVCCSHVRQIQKTRDLWHLDRGELLAA